MRMPNAKLQAKSCLPHLLLHWEISASTRSQRENKCCKYVKNTKLRELTKIIDYFTFPRFFVGLLLKMVLRSQAKKTVGAMFTINQRINCRKLANSTSVNWNLNWLQTINWVTVLESTIACDVHTINLCDLILYSLFLLLLLLLFRVKTGNLSYLVIFFDTLLFLLNRFRKSREGTRVP